MELSKRQFDILKLLSTNKWTTGKDIAEKCNCSLRTVQSELTYLKKAALITSSEKGYCLTSNVNFNNICQIEKNNDFQLILNKLLSNDTPQNLYDLAEEFYLSDSSLQKRLKQIIPYIKNENLQLIINKNTVFIQGKEIDKRRMFKKMIFSNLPLDNFDENLVDYFDDLPIITVKNIILSSIADEGYYVQSSYSSGLLLGIMIALYRMYKGIHPMEEVISDENSIEYKLAEKICCRFANHYKVYPNREDIQYISSLLQGQIFGTNIPKDKSQSDKILEKNITQLLNTVLEDYLIVIDSDKYVHNLCLHIKEMIRRCSADNYITDNTHTTMRENCPFIYDVAVSFAKKLEAVYNVRIPNEEIGFLSVHIGLIIENDIKTESTVRILLLSDNYHQIADNIKEKILSQNNNVIINLKNLTYRIIDNNIDLIITTRKIDVIGKNVIEVSPFYNIIDQSQVNSVISSILKEKEENLYRNYILSCFSPHLFFRRNDISDKDAAIKFLCANLKDFGAVNAQFEKNVFEREKMSSTCFFSSFAIPHSIHMNAKRTMLAILINEDGIIWDDNRIQICILIAMSQENRKQFSQLYNGIVQVLCDKPRLKKLIASKTLGEFMNNIK
ncbi:MAG: PTS sugar transporter subunit IIA [Erysipelotrichia bacterium]|nr:PTS sugar transporter subunit IIA [Erysipelotrichia bacterium]